MYELIVEKKYNPIFNLSIAYGLLALLEDNVDSITLHNFKGAYVLRYDTEVDTEDLILMQTDRDEKTTFGKSMQKTQRNKLLKEFFGESGDGSDGVFSDSEYVDVVLRYYQTLDEKLLKDAKLTKPVKHSWIGSPFSVKGQRSKDKSSQPQKIFGFERQLSQLGFIRACSFVKLTSEHDYSNEIDFLTWMPIPSEKGIEEIRAFDFYSSVDEETGELKIRNIAFDDSYLIANNNILLNVQQAMTISNIKDNYDGVYIIRANPAGQRPLNDKIAIYDWLPFSEEVIESIMRAKKAYSNDKKINYNLALSKWCLNRQVDDLSGLANVISKEERNVTEKETEEFLAMADLKDLHNNKGVNKLARRLYELSRDKKGYSITVELLDVSSKNRLMRVVSELSTAYDKHRGYALWDEEERQAFLDIVSNDEFSASDVSTAILLTSRTIPNKKEDIEETKNQGDVK